MKVRPESLAVTKLDLFFHNLALGSATGFIYKYGQDIALVSNWHVFSGVNPLTGNTRDKNGLYPNQVNFNINLFDPINGSVLFRAESLPLIADEQSLWWQHEGYADAKGHSQIVDIGVLVLNERIPDFEVIKDKIVAFPAQVLVNMSPAGEAISFEPGYPRVAAEVFILGYPKGLTLQGALPVWKRGSIASEPLFNVMKETPAFLVDAVTRDGMSGSPVLYFGDEITDVLGRPRGGILRDEPWLVGVYAGRQGVTGEEIEMALGRVWHKRLLDEIFFQQVPGIRPKVA
jgi:hypothetical protein